MKNLFLALGFATILASCSNSAEEAAAPVADSTACCADTCKKTCDSVKAEAATVPTEVATITTTETK